MKVCIAVLCLVATCLAMTTTTHRPHHTHEPNEGESFTFAYNGRSHDLVIRHVANKVYMCYVATISSDERQMVHSDSGMRSIELRVLSQLSSAIAVDKSAIDTQNLKLCGHAPHNGTVNYFTVP